MATPIADIAAAETMQRNTALESKLPTRAETRISKTPHRNYGCHRPDLRERAQPMGHTPRPSRKRLKSRSFRSQTRRAGTSGITRQPIESEEIKQWQKSQW